MLEVKNVSKIIEGKTIINDISFFLPSREILGIVGPDGAGKSTLTRIIAGLLRPTTGEVFFEGNNLYLSSSHSFVKDTVAYMPQQFALYEDLTVEENLHFMGRLHGLPKKERENKIEKLYQFSNLKPFRKRLAGHLSGGMKQKLGLMCALMHNPKLLILDEPTNGVDPVSRREFWEVLYELLKEDTTIVLTTSYLDEAERCSQVAVMYEGRFLFMKPSEEISSLLSHEVIEIEVENPFATFSMLQKIAPLSIFVRGNSLLLFSENPDKELPFIFSAIGKKIPWKRKKPSLEDVFIAWLTR